MNGLNRTGMDWNGQMVYFWFFLDLFLVVFFMFWEFRGKNVGKTWEKLGKNLELLVLVIKELQINLGTSWE